MNCALQVLAIKIRMENFKLLWLMLAGALGALSRYGLTQWIGALQQRGTLAFLVAMTGPTFPLATLLINVLGTFVLSALTTLVLHGLVRPEWRLILGTGFLGAFTTFSTFGVEAEALISKAGVDGKWWPTALYVLGNLLLGFAAVMAGRALVLRWFVAAG